MWCHNPESKSMEIEQYEAIETLDNNNFRVMKKIGYRLSGKELMKEIMKDQTFYEESGGGVTFSGGEPLLQHKALQVICDLCEQENIHRAIDTSGMADKEIFENSIKKTNLVLFDLKIVDHHLHKKHTGIGNKQILQNLQHLDESGQPYHIRIPLIPGITDTPRNLEDIFNVIKKLSNIKQVDLLPFHDISKSKYTKMKYKNELQGLKKQNDKTLNRIRSYFQTTGIPVKIGG
jgi:pyruvate formate lyase activating enzyme